MTQHRFFTILFVFNDTLAVTIGVALFFIVNRISVLLYHTLDEVFRSTVDFCSEFSN